MHQSPLAPSSSPNKRSHHVPALPNSAAALAPYPYSSVAEWDKSSSRIATADSSREGCACTHCFATSASLSAERAERITLAPVCHFDSPHARTSAFKASTCRSATRQTRRWLLPNLATEIRAPASVGNALP